MNAREYLSQIKKLDIRINQRIEETAELRALAFGLKSPDYSSDRVQTSPDPDRQIALIGKIVKQEEEINQLIDQLVDLRHKIIGEIQEMTDERYMNLLFRRYVKYETIDQISAGMHYDYDYTCKLHMQALRAFETMNSQ